MSQNNLTLVVTLKPLVFEQIWKHAQFSDAGPHGNYYRDLLISHHYKFINILLFMFFMD